MRILAGVALLRLPSLQSLSLTLFGLTVAMVLHNVVPVGAEQIKSVATPLDVQAQSGDNYEALVVLVFDDSCGKWCNLVKPIMKELQGQYPQVQFLQINASPPLLKQAKEIARQFKIDNFLAATADNIPEVGVFSRRSTEKGPKLQKELVGLKGKEVYVAAIDHALSAK